MRFHWIHACIKEELDGVPINSSPVLSFLRDYLGASLRDINN